MTTILKRAEPFHAAEALVARDIAKGGYIAVRPLVDELSRSFPRHGPQELSAAVVTAIALRGKGLCWGDSPARSQQSISRKSDGQADPLRAP